MSPSLSAAPHERRFLAGFAALLAFLVGLVALGYLSFARMADANRWSLHTYTVLSESQGMQEALVDMEAGFRGFILTGDAGAGPAWRERRDAFRAHLAAAERLTRDNAPQTARLHAVEALAGRWMAMQQATGFDVAANAQAREAARARGAGPDDVRARSAVMRQVRRLLDEVTDDESALLRRRVGRAAALERVTGAALVVGGLFAVALAVGLGLLVTRRSRSLAAANASLAAEIGERRLAQRAAERLGRQTELILESADEGICGVDVHGYATFLNPAAAALLGRAAADAIGRPVETVLPLEDEAGSHAGPVRDTLRDGATHRLSAGTLRRTDGSVFPVELVSAPVLEDGQIVGAVVTFRDVAERREVERMKDEFVSVVSHELRTPLTSLRGSLGLLAGGRAGEVSTSGQRLLDIAVQNTDRLVRLINDILDLERIRAGRVELEPRPVPAAELVRSAADLMEPMAEKGGVRLEADAPPVRVLADADRILQVLTNLISNAVKFSPAGSTVAVSARAEGGRALFEVRDRGRGIPAPMLEAIFERFHQVDSSDARQKGGTGLGLAICRGIVEQHGGRIWAESAPGDGSTFRFTLPLAGSTDASGGGPGVRSGSGDPQAFGTSPAPDAPLDRGGGVAARIATSPPGPPADASGPHRDSSDAGDGWDVGAPRAGISVRLPAGLLGGAARRVPLVEDDEDAGPGELERRVPSLLHPA
ncbi:MAG: two-component hybrid sensor and regulator [Gemmatimonadetes bacterium]|nr:two-component hybrid sensor and regulator [Gemmatimonadota bacterium]